MLPREDEIINFDDALRRLSVLGIDSKKLISLTSRKKLETAGKSSDGKYQYRLETIEEFVKKYTLPKANYLSREEVHEKLKQENIKYNKENITNLIHKGFLKGTWDELNNKWIFKETDVEKFIEEHGNKYKIQAPIEKVPLSFEDAEKKYGQLIYSNTNELLPKYFKILGYHTFNSLIKQGFFRDMYLLIGIDVIRPNDCPRRTRYAFILDKLERFNERYVNLQQAAERLNVPYGTLTTWSYNGFFESVGGTRFVWDIEDIQKKVEESKANRGQGFGKRDNRHQPLLGNHLNTIKKYIKYREHNPIIFEFNRIVEKGFLNKSIKEREESMLTNALYRIIAGRSEIVNYTKKLSPHKIYLTDTEQEQFKATAEKFELRNLTPDDLIHLKEGLSERSYTRYCFAIRKFLFWYLSNFEKRNDFISFKKTDEWENIKHSCRIIMAHMPLKDTFEEPDALKKNFLNRKEILNVNQFIVNGHGVIEEPFISSVQWMIGFFCAIRPYEMLNLKIFDFWLDEDTGLLKKFKYDANNDCYIETNLDDPEGYGTLYVVRSKQMKSPSKIIDVDGLKMGTLIVPRLVDYINVYLESIYKKYPHLRGEDGWLFRPYIEEPELNYLSLTHIANWVKKIRPTFNFLNPKKINSFQFKNSRHSVHNIIVNDKIDYIPPVRLLEIAGLHLRHKSNRYKTMGQLHYTEPALFANYFDVINSTLNFPWDENGLKNWLVDESRKKSIFEVSNKKEILNAPFSPLEEATNDEGTVNNIKELEKAIADVEKQMKRGPGKGKDKMNPIEYLEHVEKWSQKKEKLQKELKKVKNKINRRN